MQTISQYNTLYWWNDAVGLQCTACAGIGRQIMTAHGALYNFFILSIVLHFYPNNIARCENKINYYIAIRRAVPLEYYSRINTRTFTIVFPY